MATIRGPYGTSEEETVIAYDRARSLLAVDRRRSSLAGEVVRDLRELPLALDVGEPLTLRIFLDGLTLEVFANGGRYYAGRIYPTREDALGEGLSARGGAARLVALEAWEMESIWRRCVGQHDGCAARPAVSSTARSRGFGRPTG